MAQEPIIFASNESLKIWCLALADACGGMKMITSNTIRPSDMNQIRFLIDEFVKEHNAMNEITAQIEEAQNAEEEEE